MDFFGACLSAIKITSKYSFWTLISLAVANSAVLHLSNLPHSIPTEWLAMLKLLEWFLWVPTIIFAVVLIVAIKQERYKAIRLGVTFPSPHTHVWSESKQQDGSINTQITANVLVRNRTDKPLGLSSVRLINPTIDGPVIYGCPLIKERESSYSSSTMCTGYKINPHDSRPVSLQVIIGDSLDLTGKNKKQIEATLGLTDEDGYETKVTTSFNIHLHFLNWVSIGCLEP